MKTLGDSSQATQIAKRLSKWITSQSPKSPARKGGRVQIVNPSLCHDALERLAPSLQAHHGCDLIDVNPGICLWSRHLHDFLKPRRHILIEPQREAFNEFIEPLVKEDRKRFVHAKSLIEVLNTPDGFLSEDVVKSRSSKTLTTSNNQLLMTINLTGLPDLKGFPTGTAAGYFLNDFYTSFWQQHSDMHRYGLMRILVWTPDSFKSIILPRTVESRQRQSIHLETTSSLTEIVGSGWRRTLAAGNESVWTDLVVENAQIVQGNDANVDIEVWKDRKDSLPAPPQWALPPNPDMLRELASTASTASLQEFLELDERLKMEDDGEWRKKSIKAAMDDLKRVEGSKRVRIPKANTAIQKRWRAALKRRQTLYRQFRDTAQLVNEQRNLEQRWRTQLEETGGQLSVAEHEKLETEAKALKKTIEDLAQDNQFIARKAIDDIHAYDSRPQALAWNQREHEPLLVQPSEFAPAESLSLIDLTPSPAFRQLLPTIEKCEMFDYVVGQMCRGKMTNSVYSALTDLLQAGVDEFIETCPSLKDPIQGGWYDLHDLRVRSLPAKLLFDITLAWEKWPFRPDWRQLMLERRVRSTFEEDPD